MLQIEENVDSDRLRLKLHRAKKRTDTEVQEEASLRHPAKKARTLPGIHPIDDARKSVKKGCGGKMSPETTSVTVKQGVR